MAKRLRAWELELETGRVAPEKQKRALGKAKQLESLEKDIDKNPISLEKDEKPSALVKSSTADSEHTPHPFYSHLSQSSCVKRRLGHSSSATYGLHFQIDYASNTNPQSGSSYSLRVLKSLHEIFRAPFLILGLKHCQSSSPAWRKLSAKTLA